MNKSRTESLIIFAGNIEKQNHQKEQAAKISGLLQEDKQSVLQLYKKRFNNEMSRIRAGFIILADILLLTALVMIYYIDQLVNSTLYYFGLIPDAGWMQPYFLASRLFVVIIIAAIITVSLVELPISAFKEKE